MLVPFWTLLSISSIWAQNIQSVPEGARFEWGWSLQSPGNPATTGQYYIRLPQSEQRVSYSADNSGYHTAVAINTSGDHHSHEATFALGDQALRLLKEQESQLQQQQHQQQQQPETSNSTQDLLLNANEHPHQPLDIYLLQQQYSPLQNQQFVQIHNPDPNLALQYGIPNYYTNTNQNLNPPPYYVVHHDEKPKEFKAKENIETSNGPDPILQVFKNHNCTEDENQTTEETTKLFERTSRKNFNINGNFGDKTLKYKGTVNFRVDAPDGRQNARSERIFMAEATTARSLTDDEGISRLVASTQDLISNDDLLTINHAFEKSYVHNDDIIKPLNKNEEAESIRYEFVQVPKKQFTVRTKIGNVIGEVQHYENSTPKKQLYQPNKQYLIENPVPPTYTHSPMQNTFTSPIIVKDSTVEDFKEQVVNNIVSTVSPYLDEGYEVASIRSTLDENLNRFINMQQSKEYEDSTSRPVGQNYLAPITVGLRLLNANDTEIFNTVDVDHEGSDTELVPETIKSPVREKTVVEVQESIPLEITHINDVEHHEYLEDGRSNENTPLDAAKSLYDRFVQALESSRKIQENMNEQLYKTMTQGVQNLEGSQHFNDSDDDTLEPSANIQTEVEIRPDTDSDASNERREFVRLHHNHNRGKNFIQPIIIEKEVPVTKYVDRVVEKRVPYPEKVEVVKEVDRPIVLPVPIQRIVDRPVEVTRYVDKPYPINVPQPYPVEIKVPYPIEKQVFVDRPVHVPYTVEKVIEKQILQPVPIPTAVPIPVEVPVEKKVYYPFTVEKHIAVPVAVEKRVPYETVVEKKVPVPYPVEKRVPYPVPFETKVPVPYPVEKRIPVPVDRIVEKPVTITKFVDKPVRVEVPVPQPVPYPVKYPQPYPVEKIVEKKVPYPVQVDRIVEKRVPYQVPYPVEKIVEKLVEKPVVVTKYVNKPYPVEKKVPYPVETIVETKIPYPVRVPFEVKVPYAVEKIVEKPVHVPIKVPYPVEKIVPIFYSAQSQNVAQKTNAPNQITAEQYYQHLREKERQKERENKQEIQSIRWGNHYASSYQYINDTKAKPGEFKKTPLLEKYLSYITNNNNNRYQYYGPPPTMHSEDSWGRRNQDFGQQKLRRTDRAPKMTNLRIEYGFKPPLIPSTEVDLDGVPVNKEE